MANMLQLSEQDTFRIAVAALLHDIAKNLPREEAVSLASRHGETLDFTFPTIVHQFTGAMLAKDLFPGVVDDATMEAISCHTTGKVGMTPMDEMLFSADFMEPHRKYPSCNEMRAYFHRECEKIEENAIEKRYALLHEVMLKIMSYTISFLAERNKKIDPIMINAWNSMV